MDALANRSDASEEQEEAHDEYMSRMREELDEVGLPYE